MQGGLFAETQLWKSLGYATLSECIRSLETKLFCHGDPGFGGSHGVAQALADLPSSPAHFLPVLPELCLGCLQDGGMQAPARPASSFPVLAMAFEFLTPV